MTNNLQLRHVVRRLALPLHQNMPGNNTMQAAPTTMRIMDPGAKA